MNSLNLIVKIAVLLWQCLYPFCSMKRADISLPNSILTCGLMLLPSEFACSSSVSWRFAFEIAVAKALL
jgi:hypothetical protein